jgi:hypothetical protein
MTSNKRTVYMSVDSDHEEFTLDKLSSIGNSGTAGGSPSALPSRILWSGLDSPVSTAVHRTFSTLQPQ